MASYCIFSAHYLPHIGGVEGYTNHLAHALADLGNTVKVVTNNTENVDTIEYENSRITVYRLPCLPAIRGRYPIPVFDKRFRMIWDEAVSGRCDGVIVNTRFYLHTLLGIRLAKKKNLVPLVIDHGSTFISFGSAVLDPFVRVYEELITRLIKRSSAVFYGVSARSEEWLTHFKISAKGTIPLAIDQADFINSAARIDYREKLSIADDVPIVVFTGRLEPIKGIDCIISVANEAQELGRSFHFVIAGTGSMENEIKASEKKLRNLHYLGGLDSSHISALLQQSDLFLFPSRSEGFGASLLEAAAAGVPLLSTDVGIAPLLIAGGRGGAFIERDNPCSVVELIASLLEDDSSLETMRDFLKTKVRDEFSWNRSALLAMRACRDANKRDK